MFGSLSRMVCKRRSADRSVAVKLRRPSFYHLRTTLYAAKCAVVISVWWHRLDQRTMGDVSHACQQVAGRRGCDRTAWGGRKCFAAHCKFASDDCSYSRCAQRRPTEWLPYRCHELWRDPGVTACRI